MNNTLEPYKRRPIRPMGLWSVRQWRLKTYGIAYGRDAPKQRLVDAAGEVVEDRLVSDAERTNHYGLGFVGVHEGNNGNFVFLDWWADENELHHHVYVSPKDDPASLVYKTPTGLAACAWDLRVVCFERQAWVEHVLMRAPDPDFPSYLAEKLNEDA